MHSKTPKILHTILGKTLIGFVVDLAREIKSSEIVCVVSKNARTVRQVLGTAVTYAVQPVPRGTGDAALKGINKTHTDNILILYGDVPLLQSATIEHLIHNHEKHGAALTFLTCTMANPFGYGRILRKGKKVLGIVEQSDATPQQQRIREINTGIYYGRKKMIVDALRSITKDNKQEELYLTDVVPVLLKKGHNVIGLMIHNEEEIMGINSKGELARARAIVKRKWYAELMEQGVYIEDPTTTTIDLSVRIGDNVHIRPYTMIEGNTTIKRHAEIGPFTWIKDGKMKGGFHLGE